jgi:hypothetical protein
MMSCAIPVEDPVRGNVGRVVEPPVDPQLELLPTNLMDWEDFERTGALVPSADKERVCS